MLSVWFVVPVVLAIYLLSSIKILSEFERAVIFRLGRFLPNPRGPVSLWYSGQSIAWFASRCESTHLKYLLRTS
jgi:hypothetical protein